MGVGRLSPLKAACRFNSRFKICFIFSLFCTTAKTENPPTNDSSRFVRPQRGWGQPVHDLSHLLKKSKLNSACLCVRPEGGRGRCRSPASCVCMCVWRRSHDPQDTMGRWSRQRALLCRGRPPGAVSDREQRHPVVCEKFRFVP